MLMIEEGVVNNARQVLVVVGEGGGGENSGSAICGAVACADWPLGALKPELIGRWGRS